MYSVASHTPDPCHARDGTGLRGRGGRGTPGPQGVNMSGPSFRNADGAVTDPITGSRINELVNPSTAANRNLVMPRSRDPAGGQALSNAAS